MTSKFASQGDLEEKKVTFEPMAEGVYAYTAEGDPNSGVIIGDDAVMIIDAQATPIMAQNVIAKIREVSNKPLKYLILTHYHAVRVLGASAYHAEYIISSQETYDLIKERGEQDFKSELERFPRLFQSAETIPGLTWPNMTFRKELSIWMGKREVRLMQIGRGHTKGDIVVWLPHEKILFSGDLVEYSATPYTGDAYLQEWPETLENIRALSPEKLVPGRGAALQNPKQVLEAIEGTRSFIEQLYAEAKKGIEAKRSLKEVFESTQQTLRPQFGEWVIYEHCIPFDVTRAYDEASGIKDPRIWTAERDKEMWKKMQGE